MWFSLLSVQRKLRFSPCGEVSYTAHMAISRLSLIIHVLPRVSLSYRVLIWNSKSMKIVHFKNNKPLISHSSSTLYYFYCPLPKIKNICEELASLLSTLYSFCIGFDSCKSKGNSKATTNHLTCSNPILNDPTLFPLKGMMVIFLCGEFLSFTCLWQFILLIFICVHCPFF